MPAHPVPVTIRGVTYPSISAAARHFNLCVSTVFNALERGKLDGVGLAPRSAKYIAHQLALCQTHEQLLEVQTLAKNWVTFHKGKHL